MRVLVTGSRGFVGKETCWLLEREGHEVIHFDLVDGVSDIRSSRALNESVSSNKPGRILHLAAVARFADADADPLLALETNALGTQRVADVASYYGIPLVYSSTGSVYMPISQEPPITEDFPVAGNSVYGCTKLMGELYVRQSDSPWIILRYAHLYGKEKRHSGLVANFIERIERGLAPTLYGGQQSNDFTYIRDVARANLLALTVSEDRAWNQVYNIGTGEELTAEAAGRAVLEAWGAGHWEMDQQKSRSVDAQRFVYDVSKAIRLLQFRADYSFAEGLAAMAP